MNIAIPAHIEAIVPYPPGKPLEEIERQYGLKNAIKLASNENPFGPSPKALQAIQNAMTGLHRYPDGSGYYLVRALAEHHQVEPNQIVLGNGSNEVIEFLVKAYVNEDDEVITSHPSFLMYSKFVQIKGGVNRVVPLRDMAHDLDAIAAQVTERTRLVFIDNPNNPTGSALSPELFASFLDGLPDTIIVIIDEAYADFMEAALRVPCKELISDQPGRCGVVCLRTFSKAYGLAGLRAGYGLMHESIAAILNKVRQPFNVNSFALAAAHAAIHDRHYYNTVVSRITEAKEQLMRRVEELGCSPYPSHTNFFLINIHDDAATLCEAMLHSGVIVRPMSSYGFTNCFRISVGTDTENERFLEVLSHCLKVCGYG
jgi:histidinol-phosphate aminotransferase